MQSAIIKIFVESSNNKLSHVTRKKNGLMFSVFIFLAELASIYAYYIYNIHTQVYSTHSHFIRDKILGAAAPCGPGGI